MSESIILYWFFYRFPLLATCYSWQPWNTVSIEIMTNTHYSRSHDKIGFQINTEEILTQSVSSPYNKIEAYTEVSSDKDITPSNNTREAAMGWAWGGVVVKNRTKPSRQEKFEDTKRVIWSSKLKATISWSKVKGLKDKNRFKTLHKKTPEIEQNQSTKN